MLSLDGLMSSIRFAIFLLSTPVTSFVASAALGCEYCLLYSVSTLACHPAQRQRNGF